MRTIERMGGAHAALPARVIDVEGHQLSIGPDDEPRIRDLDLAAWLEFDRDRKFRDLIRRHKFAGNINPIEVRTTVGQTGGRPAREYWLCESDALFIATRAETQKAIAVTRDMIRVFMLARRGLLPHPAANDSALANAVIQLTQVIAASNSRVTLIDAKVDALTARMERSEHPHGMIDKAAAREILDEMQAIASEEHDRKAQPSEWRKARGSVDTAVRRAALLPMGTKWEALDTAHRARAWQKLGELRAEAKARAAAKAEAVAALKQRTLFDALPVGIKAFS